MGRLSRAAIRCAARLVPAERRAWTEALWAEADEVPPGLARLAWRAGGVRLIVREALPGSRAARALMFAAAAHHRELAGSVNASGYGLILLVFPVIGLVLGLAIGALANESGPLRSGPPLVTTSSRR